MSYGWKSWSDLMYFKTTITAHLTLPLWVICNCFSFLSLLHSVACCWFSSRFHNLFLGLPLGRTSLRNPWTFLSSHSHAFLKRFCPISTYIVCIKSLSSHYTTNKHHASTKSFFIFDSLLKCRSLSSLAWFYPFTGYPELTCSCWLVTLHLWVICISGCMAQW